jgi:cytochrome b561
LLRNTRQTYGLVAIALHWTIAGLILGQIALGLTMVRLGDPRLTFDLIQWHKSLGLLTLALVAVRLLWRFANITPELPHGMSQAEALAARKSHGLLYAWMLALPISGWILVSVSTLGIPTFAFYLFIVPHLPLTPSDAAEAWWANIHALLAYALIVLIALHAAAALWHHFWRRDDVLTRMLGKSPSFRKKDSGGGVV